MSMLRWRSASWSSWRAEYAVRRDWPDGTHDIVGFRDTDQAVARFIRRDRAKWRRGPLRPVSWSPVQISAREVALHGRRHECRAPDCPTGVSQHRVAGREVGR